jgi:hypothetical protein
MELTGTFNSKAHAGRYLREHDKRAKMLTRASAASLRQVYRDTLADFGTVSVIGGPVSKDELVNAILGLEYPPANLNEAIHLMYHEGAVWDACEWCIK